jgi:PAS domain S-box-containing protein
VEHLDLATVIKISQAVSSEMVVEKLIETFMRTALEQAGAERGLLILARGTEQRTAAEAFISGDTMIVQARDESVSATVLPESVLHCVLRTQESVILEDASAQNPFSADPYFGRQRTRSVLCLPLLYRGTLIGALYLENNVASRVFAPARIPVLKLLASQAAISLENTRLYRDLAKREAKIRRLVDANIFGIFIWDLNGTILDSNDAFLQVLGYEREDLVAGRLHWTDLTAAQWGGRDRQELLAEVQRTGSLQPFEWEHVRKDGNRVPVLVGAASFEGENEGVAFVLDLTERKRAEQARRQGEAYLAESQRLTHTGSFAFDPSAGKVVYWSDEMFRIYGRDPRGGESLPTYEELLRYVHPDDRDGFNEATERGRDDAEMTLDFRIVMADGAVRHVQSTRLPALDKTGALVETVGTLVDVTERRHAEQRLLVQYRVTRILADAATVEEATPKILQAMCECLGWDLGAVWRIDPKAGVLRCEELWRTPTVEAAHFETVTRKSTFRSGSGLPGRVWETGAPAYIPDVGHDVAYRRLDSAARQVLRAAIAFPILLGREIIGVIGFISGDVSQPDRELLGVLANIGSQIGQFTERKGVEQALRQSEAYLAEAQRLSHTGSWAYDHVLGKVKNYSDETFRLYGLDPRRPSGPPQLEETRQLIHPQDRERVFVQLAQIFRDKTEYEQQFRIVLPDGTVRHLHSIGHPVLNKAGELVEYFGSVTDVTERRHAEHRLLVQHRVTRILADAATVEEAIPKILEMMGEWPGWDLGALWQNDRHAGVLRCAELWRTPSLEAAQFETVIRTSTFSRGSGLPGRVWASGAPAYIPDVIRDPEFDRADIAAREGLHGAFAFPILLDSEVLGVMGFFSRDVWQADQNLLDMMATIGNQIGQFTKRAATVDELQLRVSMLQNIPVAAWSVMPDGTPDIVNQLWYEYTGQTPEYVNSHPEAWMATLHPEDRERASQSYWDGIRSGRGFTMEARLLRARDGTYRWHLNRAVAVRDAEGKILRFVGTSTDVHDWRQAQEALRNTQTELAHMTRVMTMGELTASIAHEVNQPLGAIVTSAAAGARWLATKPPQMDKARRALERIANDGKRAAEVIRRIRALMKRQAPRKEWLDINETVLEVIALAQYQLRRSEILLETRLGHDLPLVRGDRVQLQQVLLNLIINAIEAMCAIKERPRELTIVSASDGPDTVSVEVRDSGTGLDPEHAPHLFEPFYTTKAEGLGIGLSISLSILEAHGGRLSVAANAPHGTVFHFSLPVNETAP